MDETLELIEYLKETLEYIERADGLGSAQRALIELKNQLNEQEWLSFDEKGGL